MVIQNKILFCSEYPTLPTRYSRVANDLSNHLAKSNIVYYFGLSNKDQNDFINNKIDDREMNEQIIFLTDGQKGTPNETNLFEEQIIEIKPQIIFIYNNLLVVCKLLNSIVKIKHSYPAIKFKVVVYLDLIYKYEKLILLNHVNNYSDQILVSSSSWKDHLLEFGFEEEKVQVLEPFINTKKIFKITKEEARKICGFDLSDFIILNTNKNIYRKGWDITIKSFLYFIKKCKEESLETKHIKLLVNALIDSEDGYDLLELIAVSCLKFDLLYKEIVNVNIMLTPNSSKLSDEKLNYIYNCADVGLNTSFGEGIGLCNLEHASVGVPQIVSSVGGVKDIFCDQDSILITPTIEMSVFGILDQQLGEMMVCDYKEFSKALLYYYKNKYTRELDGEMIRERIIRKYDMEKKLEELNIL